MTIVLPKDRHLRHGKQPNCDPPQSHIAQDQHLPCSLCAVIGRRTSTGSHQRAMQHRQPAFESAPVALKQPVPSANLIVRRSIVEERLNGFGANQPKRLRKIRKHARRPSATPASKPTYLDSQTLRVEASQPAPIVAQRSQSRAAKAKRTARRREHPRMATRLDILFRRPLRLNNDLHGRFRGECNQGLPG
jgi:hypothetical protein